MSVSATKRNGNEINRSTTPTILMSLVLLCFNLTLDCLPCSQSECTKPGVSHDATSEQCTIPVSSSCLCTSAKVAHYLRSDPQPRVQTKSELAQRVKARTRFGRFAIMIA